MKGLSRFGTRVCCVAALAGAFMPGVADAYPVTAEPAGVKGMNPHLVESPDGAHVYLFSSADTMNVLRYVKSTGAWETGAPPVPLTGVDIREFACWNGQCWGGPAYAIDGNGTLHVVWGELGWNDCNPASAFMTSTVVWHTQYTPGGAWSPREWVTGRQEGEARCGFQKPALATDGAGNLVVAYYHAVHLGGDTYDDGAFFQFRPARGVWSEMRRASNFKAGTSAAGRAGRLFIGYVTPSYENVAEISAATGEITARDSVFTTKWGDPILRLAPGGDLHMHWNSWSGAPEHVSSILYDHRNGAGAWDTPNGTAIVDGAVLGPVPSADQGDAVVSLSFSPSGRRALVFSYLRKPYFIASDGGAWSLPQVIETSTDARGISAAFLDDDRLLVAWSTGMSGDADVMSAVVDLRSDPCAGHCANGKKDCGEEGVDCGGGCPACGDPCTQPGRIIVSEDHTVDHSNPAAHAGDASDLSVELDDVNGGVAYQAHLKFDVAVPPGHRVASATVNLYCDSLSGPAYAGGNGGDIFAVDDNGWDEDTVTWDTRPATAGAALDSVAQIAQGNWYSFDVGAAMTAGGTYSFALVPNGPNGGHYLSKEGGATAGCRQPYLTTTTQPDPGYDGGSPDTGTGDAGSAGDAGAANDTGSAGDAGTAGDTEAATDSGAAGDSGTATDASGPAPSDAGKNDTGSEPFEYDTVGCGCSSLGI